MTIALKFPPVVERALVPSGEKAAEESRRSFAKLVFGTVMAAGYASALTAFLYPFVYYYYTYTPY
jgi:hypothetical protein